MGKEKDVRGREGENGQWGGNRKSKEKRINGEGEKENQLLKVDGCELRWESWYLLIIKQGVYNFWKHWISTGIRNAFWKYWTFPGI